MPRVVAAGSLMLLLLASGARAATRLAFLGVDGAGVSADEKATAEEVVLDALGDGGAFSVVGVADVRNLLGFERAKLLLGCDDDSCLTEIAGALGTGLVGSARVGRLGKERIATLKIIDATRARVLVRVERTVGDGDALAEVMRALAREAVERWQATLPGAGKRELAVAAFVTGGVLVAASAGATGFAASEWSVVESHCDAASKECDGTGLAAARAGAAVTPWMDAGYVAAALATGAGVWLWISGAKADERLAVVPTDGGATLLVAGRF